jgi:hypothetical protein
LLIGNIPSNFGYQSKIDPKMQGEIECQILADYSTYLFYPAEGTGFQLTGVYLTFQMQN